MDSIPDWKEACAAFVDFLLRQNQPAHVRWVFRDDLYQRSLDRVITPRRQEGNRAQLAAKVFADGRAKGLVELIGLASSDRLTLATVWYPRDPDEEAQGWDQGMKLSIRTPLPQASLVSSTAWTLLKLFPSFRRYQSLAAFIGTTKWAAA